MENQHEILRGWGSIPAILATPDDGEKSNRKKWRPNEVQLLRDNWPDVDEVQRLLKGRSKESIRQMAMKTGLAKRSLMHWAPAETQLLVDIYPRTSMDECLRLLPNRSEQSIRAKANSLGLIRMN